MDMAIRPKHRWVLAAALGLGAALAGCLTFSPDRSIIPECYLATDCAKDQICSDAGVCKKPTPVTPVQDAGADGSALASVSGTATMGAGLAAECYATGPLYLSLVASCPSMTNQNPQKMVTTSVQNADLSQAGKAAAFVFSSVAAGTYYVSAFFDHNNNANVDDPAPDANDVLGGVDLAGDGKACIKVVVGSSDVTGVQVPLDAAKPF